MGVLLNDRPTDHILSSSLAFIFGPPDTSGGDENRCVSSKTKGATMTMRGKGASGLPEPPIAAVVARMQQHLQRLPARVSHLRVFLSTYQRTTHAVGQAVERGSFEDPGWVERWDVAFAQPLHLSALDTEARPRTTPSGPVAPGLPPPPPICHRSASRLARDQRHMNYDLPQALLRVISEDDWADQSADGPQPPRRRAHRRGSGGAGRIRGRWRSQPEGAEHTRPAAHPAQTGWAPIGSCVRLGRRSGTTPSSCRPPASQARMPYAARLTGARALSAAKIADLLRRARSCSVWPSPASASPCHHRAMTLKTLRHLRPHAELRVAPLT